MNNGLQGINIFLVGMMGVGKTTVGPLLAHQLGYSFVDIDIVIEKFAGQTINQIFAERGEEAFRQIESQVLSEVSAHTRLTVATGGGVVLRRFNWSYLHHGLIVWLDAPVEVLIKRLQNDMTRPLLKEDAARSLQKLLDERRHLYAEADIHIRVNANDTPEAIASRVIAEIPTVLKSPPHHPFTDIENS